MVIFIIIICWSTHVHYHLSYNFFTIKNPTTHQHHNSERPQPPFPVHIIDARLSDAPFSLSSIRIPSYWYHPSLQRKCKAIRFSKRNRDLCNKKQRRYTSNHTFLSFLLLPLFLFKQLQAVHHLPGTNYAIMSGGQSNDTMHQKNYVRNVLK